jgi:hypothetical protein
LSKNASGEAKNQYQVLIEAAVRDRKSKPHFILFQKSREDVDSKKQALRLIGSTYAVDQSCFISMVISQTKRSQDMMDCLQEWFDVRKL